MVKQQKDSLTIDDLAIMVKHGFDEVTEKLSGHYHKFKSIDQRFDLIDQRFDQQDGELTSFRLEVRHELEQLNGKINRVEKMLTGDIGVTYEDIKDLKIEMRQVQQKILKLEQASKQP